MSFYANLFGESKPNEAELKRKEVQQHAEQLGIYEIILNITNKGIKDDSQSQAKWENCTLRFNHQEIPREIAESEIDFKELGDLRGNTASIIMPDDTILYRSEGDNSSSQKVTDFRFGKWVERITAYSNELTKKREQEKQDKLAKEKEEQLKPFSEIDF